MKNTALLLIDLQNDYFPGGRMELSGAEEALINAEKLLNYAREKGVYVIFMQHFAVQPEATFFLPDTAGAQLHESLVPFEHEPVLKKNYPNSFRETGLEDYLLLNSISQLFICGMMSHMCVDATVRAAFDKDYSCILAHDSCATRSLQFLNQTVDAKDVQTAFMAALSARYAQVLNTSECLEILDKQDRK